MPRLPLFVTLPIKEPLRQVWRYQEFELQTILTVLPSKIRKYLHCRQSSTPLRSAMASLPQGLERSKSRLVTFCISARFVLAKSCETLCRHGLDWPLGSAERWWSMDTHWPAELGGQGWKHISCFFLLIFEYLEINLQHAGRGPYRSSRRWSKCHWLRVDKASYIVGSMYLHYIDFSMQIRFALHVAIQPHLPPMQMLRQHSLHWQQVHATMPRTTTIFSYIYIYITHNSVF